MTNDMTKDNSPIRPGMRCDIIVHKDLISEKADIRKAVVYDIEENAIILSQTTPPLTPKLLGRNVDITFMDKGTAGSVRIGFIAKFAKILTDYKLYSTASIAALVMIQQDTSKHYMNFDLRMLYRVKTELNSGIHLYINKKTANLIDFSSGGLCFNHTTDHALNAGQVLSILLDIDGEQQEINAKIVRKFAHPYAKKNNIGYTCVEFISPNERLKHLLSKKALEIERRQLSRGRL